MSPHTKQEPTSLKSTKGGCCCCVGVTTAPLQTKNLGRVLAQEFLKILPRKKALIIGLEGDLGGGKTTFLQGFAKGLGIRQKILSPTFVLMKKFEIPKRKVIHWFYHVDCYRIEKPKELLGLGFEEIISNPENIVAVEWADRVRKIMPKDTIWIRFEFVDEKTRKIEMHSLRITNFFTNIRKR